MGASFDFSWHIAHSLIRTHTPFERVATQCVLGNFLIGLWRPECRSGRNVCILNEHLSVFILNRLINIFFSSSLFSFSFRFWMGFLFDSFSTVRHYYRSPGTVAIHKIIFSGLDSFIAFIFDGESSMAFRINI